MRIKSFFAKSVDQAIAQARAQLGAEALLLNTRKVPSGKGQPGGYEVVFGTATEEAPPAVGQERLSAREGRPSPDGVEGELERLHQQMDEIRSLIVRSSRSHLNVGRTVPELADVYARLMSAEVNPALSKDIVDRLEASMATDAFFERAGTGPERTANRWKALRGDPQRLEAFVRAELKSRVGVDSRLGVDGAGGTAVVLVGPTGSGKTTSLAKLAASGLGLAAGRTLRLLTLDTSRPSATPHLQWLANSLGIAFAPVPAPHLLPELIANARNSGELVLIDTPGYAGNDRKGAETAAAILAKCQDLDVHLVVPGYMRAGDLRACIDRYAMFKPAKLLVTKLDETQSLGPVFSEAVRAGLSLSFLAHGPAIPDDIRPASVEDFVAMVIDRQARAQGVA